MSEYHDAPKSHEPHALHEDHPSSHLTRREVNDRGEVAGLVYEPG
jgi:hypothetical protein